MEIWNCSISKHETDFLNYNQIITLDMSIFDPLNRCFYIWITAILQADYAFSFLFELVFVQKSSFGRFVLCQFFCGEFSQKQDFQEFARISKHISLPKYDYFVEFNYYQSNT